MTGSVGHNALKPSVVCGLLTERGEQARSARYDRAWQRDHAVWRAVEESIHDAAAGARPRNNRSTPPAWLEPLARQVIHRLATRTSWGSAFATIRSLERSDLLRLPVDDDYVLAAVGGLADRWPASRAQALRDDPELVDRVVWRMFEVEGGGEVSLANVDKFTAPTVNWQTAFVELTADGTLDRERVLTRCLGALNRDFSAYRAGWYSRLYDALSPTVDELDRHQPLLRRLLRSNVTATVTFTVNKLKVLSDHGRLDDAGAVVALGPAVLATAKGTALIALRLTAEVADRTPAAADEAVQTARVALEHPHADVQRAAAALLDRLGAHEHIHRAADDLEPSVRHALGLTATAEATTAQPDPQPPTAHLDLRPALPRPIGDRDVLDRTAALLEDAGDALEVEFVLAGLAQLNDPAVLRPLAKRATTVLGRGPREDVVPGWLRGQLARLVLVADGQRMPRLPAPTARSGLLAHRLGEAGDVLGGSRPPAALMSTPDDSRGWLNPATLVARLATAGTQPGRHDLVAAVLRLHPEGREAALTALEKQPTSNATAAVRYALGGPPPAARRLLQRRGVAASDPALWVAASRARAPLAVDAWLDDQGISGAGRSAPVQARVVFTENPYQWSDARGQHDATYWTWELEVSGRGDRPGDDDEPTAVGHDSEDPRFRESAEDFVGWTALTYPHDTEVFLLDAVHPVLSSATSGEVQHDVVRVLRALETHPGRLGALAVTALAAGLTARKADQRALAVDAVHALHLSGRLSAEELGQGLQELVGPATLTRWAAALRDLAAVDAAGATLTVGALTQALPSVSPASRGVHALLELLNEERLRMHLATPDGLRTWLQQFTGSSRAAKAARALLNDR